MSLCNNLKDRKSVGLNIEFNHNVLGIQVNQNVVRKHHQHLEGARSLANKMLVK